MGYDPRAGAVLLSAAFMPRLVTTISGASTAGAGPGFPDRLVDDRELDRPPRISRAV